MKLLRILAILLVTAVLLSPVVGGVQAQATFERSTLTIETLGESHEFDIELALTPAQQSQGLMFRRQLAPDAGMLFYHRRDTVATMWMRNTFIPLDMLFVAADGRIVHIVERTVPQSLTTISAGRSVRAVLELNAGTVRRLAIREGNRLVHPLFGNAD